MWPRLVDPVWRFRLTNWILADASTTGTTMWILSGSWVELKLQSTTEEEQKCFYIGVPNHTVSMLNCVIKTHMKLGLHLITDCWKGYSCLSVLRYRYVGPVTGLHTNTIEGTWNGITNPMPHVNI